MLAKLFWESHKDILEIHIFQLSYSRFKSMLQRPKAWQKYLHLHLGEKNLQGLDVKALLAQLCPVVSHRDSQLFKINHAKNFIRNWESLLPCVKETGRKVHVWAFPYCFYESHSNTRLQVPKFYHSLISALPYLGQLWAGTCEKCELHLCVQKASGDTFSSALLRYHCEGSEPGLRKGQPMR